MQCVQRQHAVCTEATYSVYVHGMQYLLRQECMICDVLQADLTEAYCSVGDSAGWPCGLDTIRHCFGSHFDCNPTAKTAKVSLSALCSCSNLILHICLAFLHMSTHHQVQVAALKAGTAAGKFKRLTRPSKGMFQDYWKTYCNTCIAAKVTGCKWTTNNIHDMQ